MPKKAFRSAIVPYELSPCHTYAIRALGSGADLFSSCPTLREEISYDMLNGELAKYRSTALHTVLEPCSVSFHEKRPA